MAEDGVSVAMFKALEKHVYQYLCFRVKINSVFPLVYFSSFAVSCL